MSFDFSTLITDRSQADVEALRALLSTALTDWTAEQLAAFNQAASRGAYNYTDLNRVTAAMEALDSMLSGMGYKTGYAPLVVHPAEPAPPSQYTYRYFRMVINAVRSGGETQLSEIRLVDENGNFFPWPSGTTVSSSMGTPNENESPAKLIDGLVTTKYYTGTYSPGGFITIDLGEGQGADLLTWTKWQWYTANDSINRDPVSFDFQVSNDGTDWETIDSVAGATITETREALAYTGSIQSPDASSDPHTLLLLEGDSLEDSSIYGRSIVNYGAVVSSDQSKFGGKSLYFNGASGLTAGVINLGDSDFTFDWWEYATDADAQSRFCTAYTPDETYGGFYAGYHGTQINASSSLNGWNLIGQQNMLNITLNTWVHWAIVRSGTTLKTYRNGILFATTSINGAIVSTDYPIAVGMQRENDPAYFIGYIDEFRVSDVARWTSDFTPPENPYIQDPEPEPDPEPGLDPYTWYEEDVPTQTQMRLYLNNVAAIYKTILSDPALPESMASLTAEGANQIEAALATINNFIARIALSFWRCGEILCGEG